MSFGNEVNIQHVYSAFYLNDQNFSYLKELTHAWSEKNRSMIF